MSDAQTKAKRADRIGQSRLLSALHGRLVRYMGHAGLIAFVDEPGTAAAPSAAPAPPEPTSAPAAAPAPAATPAPSAAPAATPAPSAAPAATPAPSAPPAAATGAPEAYADFTLPDTIKADDATMGEFKAIAKELNLPQAAAQKLVDLNAKVETARAEQWAATVDGWEAAAKADKEYGGDKFNENLAIALQTRDKVATPELVKFLNESKLGSHPEMLRLFYRVGQSISQDGFVPGRGGAPTAKAQSIYSASNMNP